MYESHTIQSLLPHRSPFLLVDRIVEHQPGKRAVGFKTLTGNEPFWAGHFPGHPFMPGGLVIEALAQVSGIAMSGEADGSRGIGLLAGIDNCRFEGQVRPGDILCLTFEVTRVKGPFVKGRGTATVEGALIGEAEIMFAYSPA